jgi:Flp pilus assembly protein TadD
MSTSHRFSKKLRHLACACGAGAAALLSGCAREDASRVVGPEIPGPAATASTVTVTAVPEVDMRPLPVEPAAASPREVDAAWREGRARFASRDFVAAAAELEIAASGRPDDAEVLYLLGLSLWKGGKPEQAEPVLERAAALDGGSSRTWINLARVRLDLDDSRSALEAADRALGIEPLSADALHQRGRALARLGRGDEALDTLSRAREAAPENGYVANTLGYWLIQAGRDAEALPLLEAARERLPDVAYVRNNLGVVYERTGRIEEAVAEYRAAVAAGDPGARAAASLARLHVVDPAATEPVAAAGPSGESRGIPGAAAGDDVLAAAAEAD